MRVRLACLKIEHAWWADKDEDTRAKLRRSPFYYDPRNGRRIDRYHPTILIDHTEEAVVADPNYPNEREKDFTLKFAYISVVATFAQCSNNRYLT